MYEKERFCNSQFQEYGGLQELPCYKNSNKELLFPLFREYTRIKQAGQEHVNRRT